MRCIHHAFLVLLVSAQDLGGPGVIAVGRVGEGAADRALGQTREQLRRRRRHTPLLDEEAPAVGVELRDVGLVVPEPVILTLLERRDRGLLTEDRGATLDELGRPAESQSRYLHAIVDRVRPSVEGLLHGSLGIDPDVLVRQAVRANIRASADHLRHGSEVLEQLIREEGVLVVGAEYSLDTGVVDFFDGVPPSAR